MISSDRMKRKENIRQIEVRAEKIYDLFSRYFYDPGDFSFKIRLTDSNHEEEVQLNLFIMEAGRIHRQLAREIERFFFDATPHVLEINEQERNAVSIQLLAKSLQQLSSLTLERVSR